MPAQHRKTGGQDSVEKVVRWDELSNFEDRHKSFEAQIDLANVCEAVGRLSKAIELFENLQKELAPEDSDHLHLQLDLGCAYLKDNQLKKANCLRSCPIDQSTLSPTHPDSFASQDNLARAYSRENQLEIPSSYLRLSFKWGGEYTRVYTSRSPRIAV